MGKMDLLARVHSRPPSPSETQQRRVGVELPRMWWVVTLRTLAWRVMEEVRTWTWKRRRMQVRVLAWVLVLLMTVWMGRGMMLTSNRNQKMVVGQQQQPTMLPKQPQQQQRRRGYHQDGSSW